MELDEQSISDIGRLRELVERDVEYQAVVGEPHLLLGPGSSALCFRGAALRLLNELIERLAAPASAGGMHPDAVQDLLIHACRQDDTSSAVRFVRDRLNASPHEWTIVEPLPVGLRSGHAGLNLGAARLFPSWAAVFPAIEPSPFDIGRYAGAVLVVNVRAADMESAKILARRKSDLARAIMSILDASPTADLGEQAILGAGVDGVYVVTEGGPREAYVPSWVDREGALYPGYRELAAAAALEPRERTDWERRCLGAVRWYRNARLGATPTEVIIACFVALEVLTIRDRREREKGRLIASRVANRTAIRGVEPGQRAQWMGDLYRDRNSAAHEAEDLTDETNARRLLDVTETVLRWSINHLTGMHQEGDRPCETFDEAWSDHTV